MLESRRDNKQEVKRRSLFAVDVDVDVNDDDDDDDDVDVYVDYDDDDDDDVSKFGSRVFPLRIIK